MIAFKNPAVALLARLAVVLGFNKEESEILNDDIETVIIKAELLMLDFAEAKKTIQRLEKEIQMLEEDRDAWKKSAHTNYDKYK